MILLPSIFCSTKLPVIGESREMPYLELLLLTVIWIIETLPRFKDTHGIKCSSEDSNSKAIYHSNNIHSLTFLDRLQILVELIKIFFSKRSEKTWRRDEKKNQFASFFMISRSVIQRYSWEENTNKLYWNLWNIKASSSASLNIEFVEHWSILPMLTKTNKEISAQKLYQKCIGYPRRKFWHRGADELTGACVSRLAVDLRP